MSAMREAVQGQGNKGWGMGGEVARVLPFVDCYTAELPLLPTANRRTPAKPTHPPSPAQEGKMPKYTAAHVYAAVAVRGAVRGFLARLRLQALWAEIYAMASQPGFGAIEEEGEEGEEEGGADGSPATSPQRSAKSKRIGFAAGQASLVQAHLAMASLENQLADNIQERLLSYAPGKLAALSGPSFFAPPGADSPSAGGAGPSAGGASVAASAKSRARLDLPPLLVPPSGPSLSAAQLMAIAQAREGLGVASSGPSMAVLGSGPSVAMLTPAARLPSMFSPAELAKANAVRAELAALAAANRSNTGPGYASGGGGGGGGSQSSPSGLKAERSAGRGLGGPMGTVVSPARLQPSEGGALMEESSRGTVGSAVGTGGTRAPRLATLQALRGGGNGSDAQEGGSGAGSSSQVGGGTGLGLGQGTSSSGGWPDLLGESNSNNRELSGPGAVSQGPLSRSMLSGSGAAPGGTGDSRRTRFAPQ